MVTGHKKFLFECWAQRYFRKIFVRCRWKLSGQLKEVVTYIVWEKNHGESLFREDVRAPIYFMEDNLLNVIFKLR